MINKIKFKDIPEEHRKTLRVVIRALAPKEILRKFGVEKGEEILIKLLDRGAVEMIYNEKLDSYKLEVIDDIYRECINEILMEIL